MMITVYTVATGKIDRLVTCPDDVVELQFDPMTQAALEGHFADDAFYVKDGEPMAIPPRPSPVHIFDHAAEAWVDPRTLEQVRAAKNEAINRARLRANQSHFTFAGKQIAVDPLSRGDIDGAHGAWLMSGGPPPGWPGGWKAIDNTYVPITDMATWGQFYGAMVATGTANFNHAQQLKAQLAAAPTIAEAEAVPDW